MRRALAAALLLASTLILVPGSARAENQGSDPLGNLAPRDENRALAEAELPPVGRYALDTHVDAGVTNPDGAIARIPHVLAELVWTLDRVLMDMVIQLFAWAFELDLVTGPDGALRPVGEAIDRIYAHTVGREFLSVSILLAGVWALYHGLVRRDYTQTTSRLALSAVLVFAALFVVQRPEQTIGGVAGWSNDFSAAALSGVNGHGFEGRADGRTAVARALQRQFIHQPWLVLNFGGSEVCTDSDARPVGPTDPRRTVCRPVDTPNREGRGGYAERFLRWNPGSEERDNEFRALAEGTTAVGQNAIIPSLGAGPIRTPGIGPRGTPDQFRGYRVDDHDRPAVDIQQRGAGADRFVLALLVFAGSLGAILLIGALTLAMVMAQVVALLLAAFSPVALVAGAVPGRGHALFAEWGRWLAGALIAKGVLALALAIVLAVAGAVQGAVAGLGFLLAFGLSSAFYWVVFLGRRRIWAAFARPVLATNAATAIPGLRVGRARAAVRRDVTQTRPPTGRSRPWELWNGRLGGRRSEAPRAPAASSDRAWGGRPPKPGASGARHDESTAARTPASPRATSAIWRSPSSHGPFTQGPRRPQSHSGAPQTSSHDSAPATEGTETSGESRSPSGRRVIEAAAPQSVAPPRVGRPSAKPTNS